MVFKSIGEPIILVATKMESIANKYVFAPMGTSSISIKILSYLEKNNQLTQTEILDFIGGTKSNLSQRLDVLEQRGLIKKEYASLTADKRKVVIKITALGKKKLKEVAERLKKAHISLEKHFTKKELAGFFVFFEKLHKIIEDKECNLNEVFNK